MARRLALRQVSAMVMIIVGSSAIAAALAMPADEQLPAGHVANAGNKALVLRGKQIYKNWCASCHGRYLQGQPLWQTTDRNAV